MSLKLYLKERLFTILDLLPEKQGFYLYHKIQDAVNGENMLQRVKSNRGSYDLFQKILNNIGFCLEGKKVIEIGSGWAPVIPYFLLYLGKAGSVSTYDLYHHFSKKKINRLNEVFTSEYGIELIEQNLKPYNLPKEITYHPNTDLIKADILEADLVYSRFVLEHVKPDDIALMHHKLKKDLKPGSRVIHFISPGDHRIYVDPDLSLQDFLQYSEAEWRKKQTRFDYHNRLRLPQYLNIFKEAGMEIEDLKFDCPGPNSPAYKKFKNVKLHEDFKHFSEKELTAGSINVVLKV